MTVKYGAGCDRVEAVHPVVVWNVSSYSVDVRYIVGVRYPYGCRTGVTCMSMAYVVVVYSPPIISIMLCCMVI